MAEAGESGSNLVARRLFAQFDKDGNDAIDAEELKGLCAALGVHMGKVTHQMLLHKLDTDDDGLISFDEFEAFWQVDFNVKELATRASLERLEVREERRRVSRQRPQRRSILAFGGSKPKDDEAAAKARASHNADLSALRAATRAAAEAKSAEAQATEEAVAPNETGQAKPEAAEEDGASKAEHETTVAPGRRRKSFFDRLLKRADDDFDADDVGGEEEDEAAAAKSVAEKVKELVGGGDEVMTYRQLAAKRLPGSCSTATSFAAARRLAKEYGYTALEKELVAAGIVSEGRVNVSGVPPNPFARLGAGLDDQPEMFEANAALGKDHTRFIFAWGEQDRIDVDRNWESSAIEWVGKASWSKRHRFMTVRDLDWRWFNVLTVGTRGRDDLIAAIRDLEDMVAAAKAFAARDPDWTEVGLFFHVYPHFSVPVQMRGFHMHVIDTAATGPTWEVHAPKCLPADAVLLVLRTELEASQSSTPPSSAPPLGEPGQEGAHAPLEKGARVVFNRRTSIAGKAGTIVGFDPADGLFRIELEDGGLTERLPDQLELFDRLDMRRRGHHAYRADTGLGERHDTEPVGTMFGWLEKQSGGKHDSLGLGNLLNKWDTRWFVLYVHDGLLMYFAYEEDVQALCKPLGNIDVSGTEVAVVDDEGSVFALRTNQRTLMLRAPQASHLGQREIDTWLEALVAAGCKRTDKLTPPSKARTGAGMMGALADHGAPPPAPEAAADNGSVTVGVMGKRTSGLLGGFMDKFFALRNGGSLLVYYDSRDDWLAKKSAAGALQLEGCTIQRAVPDELVFALVSDEHKLTIKATHLEQMNTWIEALVSVGCREMSAEESEIEEKRSRRESVMKRRGTTSFGSADDRRAQSDALGLRHMFVAE